MPGGMRAREHREEGQAHRNAHSDRPLVAIVGGGCAGTLVAANLLRRVRGPLRVVIVERSGRFGPGVAYGTEDPQHLLNVPAERMSAFCDEPLHFAEWAASRLGGIACGSYLPRAVYGEYLQAVLADSRALAQGQRSLELLKGEVVDLRRGPSGVELRLADGAKLRCDRVVLATGPLGGAQIADLPQDPRVLADPWSPGALDSVRSHGLTIVLGAGLSGVDAMLSLCAGRGRVLCLSRSGQLPYVHLPGLRTRAPAPVVPRGPVSLAALERRLVAHVKGMQAAGYDWRDAIDGLRPVATRLWAALALEQRERFLHERRRAWEIRRHRMAPPTGARLRELLANARVQRLAGSVLGVRALPSVVEVDVVCGRSARVHTFACERVVVCTGPAMDVRRSGSSLLDALLASGAASPDALGLGLRSSEDGALLDAHGHQDERVLTLGALRRGELWESTAVEEIRAQAERLARTIERSVRPRAMTARSHQRARSTAESGV
jgi:uncharacterized NAD(P)/FAD-binding protein YdhS